MSPSKYSFWQSRDHSWAAWYIGCESGQEHRLPMGSRFTVIYSPNPFMRDVGWRYIVFEVVWSKVRSEFSRMYQVVDQRSLAPEESARFETMWAKARQRVIMLESA